MSKRYAHFALVTLSVIFVLSLLDKACDPTLNFIPPEIATLAVTILAGVAIGSIIAGLTRANGQARQTRQRDEEDTGEE